MQTAATETSCGTDRGVVIRIGIGARCDVVDIRARVVLEIVHGIDAPAGPLLDRAARLVLLLRPFLPAQALRRGRGPEVRAAIAAAGTARPTGPAGTWRKTSAATRAAGPWSAEASGGPKSASLGSRRETSLAGGPWSTFFARARLAHGQVPPLKRLRVEPFDDRFGVAALGKLDKCKAARTSGLPVDRHHDVRGLSNGGEVGAEIRFGGAVREIPDEQTNCQGFLGGKTLRDACS
jgi:hypothetical protein